jgi:regulator of protease activity HflC (stomatin/prohibitin superfamily)
MLALKWLLLVSGLVLVASSLGILVLDLIRRIHALRASAGGEPAALPMPRTRTALALGVSSLVPLLLGGAIVLVPAGHAGLRIDQRSGIRPGALPAGVHIVRPLVESVVLYDLRERVFTSGGEGSKKAAAVLNVQSKEGLGVGLAVSVRYRLDPQRLDFVHANLPAALDDEIVTPVVASVFRQLAPNYMVREIFTTRREEIGQRASEAIVRKLGPDGIVVKEVMLRDVVLPPEYAKGLEGLLLKEQENEQLVYELQIKEKQVKTAELEAEAEKAREVKAAEAHAQVRVLQAKAEADAMQHTLPLKEKQIEQTRLEAEARKAATVMNAEAAAQAKVIDSKADLERSRLLADGEAHRIRVTSAADSERMTLEAAVLKDNPLLIQKIVAERLSDKMQIMIVPMDGGGFFANDVFRAASLVGKTTEAREAPTREVRRR